MNLQKWLRDGDPVTREGGLDQLETGWMRDRIVAAAAAPIPRGRRVPRVAWQVAAAAGCVALAILVGRYTREGLAPPAAPDRAQTAIESVGTPRQLHFSTPGGTRVIWLFDPEFEERR
jgi:hypothetical protein